jgi:5-keto-L-gluconate epimerase
MKKGVVICGPDVPYGPLALLSGSFEEKVAKAAKIGCDGVELMVRNPAQLAWEEVKNTLRDAGLAVSQVVTGELYGSDRLCLVHRDGELVQRTEERLRQVIDLASYLSSDSQWAMINLGRVRGRLDLLDEIADRWKVAVERIQSLAEYAAERNVRIALEPLNRYECDFILNVEEGLRFLDDAGCQNLGLMLDLFHMNIEESNIPDALCHAGNRLWHVHIADSNRRYPGSGHLDFIQPFAALKSMGYAGFVSAELLPWPDPDTAAVKTMEFLHRHLD